jgi:hypothetical protein
MFAFLRSVRDKTSMEMGLTKSRVVGRRTGNEIDDQSTGYYLTVAGQLFLGLDGVGCLGNKVQSRCLCLRKQLRSRILMQRNKKKTRGLHSTDTWLARKSRI